jgi:ATP-dependent Lhr-like helicase
MTGAVDRDDLPSALPDGASANTHRPPVGDGAPDGDPLELFHPAVREWFRRRFPAGPTEAQALGWASIASGEDTLVAAPTGSGKTLAGFLVAIDRCIRDAAEGVAPESGTEVVYVSPLRALTVDVRENLEGPLREIEALGNELGAPVPHIRVAVRNGDTPPSARAAMIRHPPQIVVTTPESLYLLVTSAGGRGMLRTTRTVIVDEIHALARDKRGSHLALTLERLERLALTRPVRIGLSATQRPIETVARLLVGSGPDRSAADGGPRCTVVDTGHRRALDIEIELTDDELGAVATNEQLARTIEIIAEHVRAHRTTLVFVNTRRMSERIAHLLGEMLGDVAVAAHHGSLSTERRLRVEARLRAGELRALVATASLELGIDVGPVDLVCQLGSPRSIATFLQRVGRAEHRVTGVPKGRLYPFTRDELVECTALLAAVHAGSLDRVHPPVAPLDILAQQLVAEVAAAGGPSGEDRNREDHSGEDNSREPEDDTGPGGGDEGGEAGPDQHDSSGCGEDELYEMVRRAAPYSSLPRADFDEIVELTSEGVVTGRGRRGAHLHRDRVHGVLRPRRGARIAAATSGGAIPEVADYRVILEPEETVVGTVNEDWAIESMAGDVFLLASHSWRIRRIEQGTVRVVDAAGAPPTVPFWLGEAPARTNELADAVSELRAGVDARLANAAGPTSTAQADSPPKSAAEAFVRDTAGVSPRVASEVVAYLAAARAALGRLPTKQDIVFERFFDDTGGMQLVVHAPFGGRINRGLGLALRKRFCRSFDFELQAAANDDAVVLSLGPQHSFPLADVARFLAPETVEDALKQAVLPTPFFTARWRWNLTRSLVALRSRGGKRVPPAIQRMEADDLMAAVFPALAACQENATGAIQIPDHPIVRQTMHDCMTEALDLEGLTELLERLRAGEIRAHFVETVEPSLLAHEILNGKPFTFLDDAPLEERRTRAVQLRRGIPLEEHDLAHLDPDAIAQVRAQAAPAPRDSEELHDLLVSLVLAEPRPEWERSFAGLALSGRAMLARSPVGHPDRWCAAERRLEVESMWPGCCFVPDHPAPPPLRGPAPGHIDPAPAAAQALRGHLETLGPATVDQLATAVGIDAGEVRMAIASLEAEGFLLRGHFDTINGGPEQVCARRLLARAHSLSRDRLRRSIAAASPQSFVPFLLAWSHVAPGTQLHGPGGLAETIEQLQGFELAVGAWEESVLPARVAGYQPGLLDGLCQQGEIVWGRLSGRPESEGTPRRSGSTPSRSTPVTLVRRDDLGWLLAAVRGAACPEGPGPGAAAEVLAELRQRGALFFAELCVATKRLPTDVAEALWDAVARGLVTADGFQAVRALLAGNLQRSTHAPRRYGRPGMPRRPLRPALSGGRWSILDDAIPVDGDADELAEAVAGQLLARWGVVFRDVIVRESLAVPWRDILFALRRLEARGVIRGGRFVAGFAGEQFALPEAVEDLRRIDRIAADGTTTVLCAADPLNVVGFLTPGQRIPAIRTNRITLLDGVPVVGDTSPPGRRRVATAAR